MSVEIVCPQCGFSKWVPEEKIPPGVKWANCPRCKARFEIKLQPSPEQLTIGEENAPGGPGAGRTEWERVQEIGIWRGFYRTAKRVLLSPGRFFGTMSVGSGLGEPFAFGLLAGVVGAMGGAFWQFLVISGNIPSLVDLDPIRMALVFALVLFATIPYVMVALLLTSLVLHICLIITRGGGSGFEATFRVVAYSQAVQFLSFIPFIGGVAAFIWLLVIQVIGLKETHRTSYGRVIMAFLMPLIALLGIGVTTVLFLSFSLLL